MKGKIYIKTGMDGNAYFACIEGYENLAEDDFGFGDTLDDAIEDLKGNVDPEFLDNIWVLLK